MSSAFFLFHREGETDMEIFVFGPESRGCCEITRLFEKCGAVLISGTNIDMLYHKIIQREADFILGDSNIINQERLASFCHFFHLHQKPILFTYNAQVSGEENADNIIKQFFKYYSKQELGMIKVVLLSLYAIVHGQECTSTKEKKVSDILKPKSFEKQTQTLRSPLFMQPAVRALYSFFYEHRNQDISMNMMSYYMWSDTEQSHINTLYSYIHHIRKHLGDTDKTKTLLVRVRPKIYRLNIPAGQEHIYKCFE